MKQLALYVILLFLMACAQDSSEKSNSEDLIREYDLIEEQSEEPNYLRQENNVRQDSLLTGIEEDQLSPENIEAFEELAIQKLRDFMDYLDIISNPDYESEFRSQALSMAEALFFEGEIMDSLLTSNQGIINIETFLSEVSNQKHGVLTPKIKAVKVSKPFELEGDELIGELSFDQKVNKQKVSRTVTIILKQTTKDFGKTQKFVWSVFLRHISYKN